MTGYTRVPAPAAGPQQAQEMLITGAASGIGRGLVESFAGRGQAIVAIDCDSGALDDLAGIAEQRGWTVNTYAVDVRDDAEIERLGVALAPRNVGVPINNGAGAAKRGCPY